MFGTDRKYLIGLENVLEFIFLIVLRTPHYAFILRSIRTFSATLGPSGGKRGYAGITGNVYLYIIFSTQMQIF